MKNWILQHKILTLVIIVIAVYLLWTVVLKKPSPLEIIFGQNNYDGYKGKIKRTHRSPNPHPSKVDTNKTPTISEEGAMKINKYHKHRVERNIDQAIR